MASKHVRLTDDVDTLAQAWTFALAHIDQYVNPTIEIQAYTELDYNSIQKYSVSIHGHVNA